MKHYFWLMVLAAASKSLGANHARVKIGSGPSNTCGGQTASQWLPHGSHAIVMLVDATHCQFKSTPQYAVSVVQDGGEPIMPGMISIVKATKTDFKVVMWDPKQTAAKLLNRASHHENMIGWQLNWIGDTGSNTGITTPSSTAWKVANSTLLYTDVNTRKCGFRKTPRYFVALNGDLSSSTFHGASGLIRLDLYGDTVAYKVSATGFRLYVMAKSNAEAQIAQLQSKKWQVSWIGVSSTDTLDASSGTSGADWNTALNDGWISTDVYTKTHAFKKIPRYIVSLSSAMPSFSLVGSSLVDSERRQHFKYYVRDPVLDITDLRPDVQRSSFSVNYYGYKDPAYWAHSAPVRLKVDRAPKQMADIRVDAELYGQGISDFTVQKRRLLLSGLATLLNLPLTDITILNTIPWSDKIIIEVQIKVHGSLEIEAAKSSIRSKKFAVSMEHRMRLANEGKWPFPKGFRATFSKPEVLHSQPTALKGNLQGFGMLPLFVFFVMLGLLVMKRMKRRRRAGFGRGRNVVPQDQVPEDFALLYKV